MRRRDHHNKRFAFAVAAKRWRAVRLIQRHIVGWLERNGRLVEGRHKPDAGTTQARLRAYAERVYMGQDDTGGTAEMAMMAVMEAAKGDGGGEEEGGACKHGVANVAVRALRESRTRAGGAVRGGVGNGAAAGGGEAHRGDAEDGDGWGRSAAGVGSRNANGHGGVVRLTASARGSRARATPGSGGGDENALPPSSRSTGCGVVSGGGGGDAMSAYRAAKSAVETAASLDKRRAGNVSSAPSSQMLYDLKALQPIQRHREATGVDDVRGGGGGGGGFGSGGSRGALATMPLVVERNSHARALTARRGGSGRGWH